MNETPKTNDYNDRLHRLGRITTAIVILALLAVPFLIGIAFDIELDVNVMMTAFLSVFAVFGPVGAIEFISYAPIFGAGGQYLAFITGNIMNMKLPSAISSIKLTGFAQGSPEADAISTIAVGISSLVTMLILVIGLGLGSLLLPVLRNPVLAPAFANLMPAILGALAIPHFLKNTRGAIGPIVVAALVLYATGRAWYSTNSTLMIPLFLVLSIGWHYLIYRLDEKKKAS